jgi:uncharacterized membrane protein
VTRPPWVAPATFVLALAGMAVAAYLTIVHYTSPKLLVCSASGVVNCEQVTTSSESMILGIPVALLGLVWFVAVSVLCSPWAWGSGSRRIELSRIGAVVAGMGFVLWLLYAELYRIRAICLWCTVVHLIAFALFILVLLYGRATAPED